MRRPLMALGSRSLGSREVRAAGLEEMGIKRNGGIFP